MFDNLHGGAQRGTATDSLLSLGLAVDTAALGAWPGGEVSIGLQAIASTHPSAYAGDLQALSNLDVPSRRQVGELWYSQALGTAALARVGIMDINSYFDVNETAAFFLNSSFGVVPTISVNVPTASYPESAWGAMGRIGTETRAWRIAAFQGQPEHRSSALRAGAMLVAERDWQAPATSTRFGVGVWHRHGPSESGTPQNDWGLYGNIERPFGTGARIGTFLQFGASPDGQNGVPAYFGGGIVFHHMAPRVSDFGIGVARAWIRHADAETSIEATVKLPFLEGRLCLQPDLQYILNPSGRYPDAFVVGMRVLMSLL